jgi:hypothetical protein
MGRGRSGIPLGERFRPGVPLASATGSFRQPGRPGRHVWVVDAPAQPGRWPGLLVEWRRAEPGWEARVVMAIAEPEDRSVARLVERWLPAGCLEPVGD